MTKRKTKLFNFHWTHFVAVVVLVCYFFISKINLVNALANKSLVISFLQIYLFGVFFACIFLYIFSHEKFFTFGKEIEKIENNTEKKYLARYLHHGKILATFIIGVVGGPVFSSLSARFLLNNFKYKYLVLILADLPSSLFTILLGKGILSLV